MASAPATAIQPSQLTSGSTAVPALQDTCQVMRNYYPYRKLPKTAVLTSPFGELYLDEDLPPMPDDDDDDDGDRGAFMEKVGATWDRRIIWVGGGLKSFIDWQCGGSMTFWAGNDGCEQDLFYCAAAIVVNVPPFAKRAAALPPDAAGLSTAGDVSGAK